MTAIRIFADEGKSFLDLFLPLIDSEIERVLEELNETEYKVLTPMHLVIKERIYHEMCSLYSCFYR